MKEKKYDGGSREKKERAVAVGGACVWGERGRDMVGC